MGLVTLSALLPILSNFVPYDTVPKVVVQATSEMARELLVLDRTAAPPGEGIDTARAAHATHAATGTASDSTSSSTKYSKADTRPGVAAASFGVVDKVEHFYGATPCGLAAVGLLEANGLDVRGVAPMLFANRLLKAFNVLFDFHALRGVAARC
jgi:hypothetical protein